jgi:condensin-2 complex subunit H2
MAHASSSSNKRVTFAEAASHNVHAYETKKRQVKKDPWALLDPHSLGDKPYTPKPLKKGKTYRLPEGVSLPPSECVTGARTSHVTPPQCRSFVRQTLRPSLAVEAFRVAMGKQLESTTKISHQGLAYGDEFLYIAKENAKLKAAKRRAERILMEESGGPEIDLGSARHYDDDDDEGYGGGFDFGGGDDDYGDDENDNAIGNSGMQNLDDAFAGAGNNDKYGGKCKRNKLMCSLFTKFELTCNMLCSAYQQD